MTKPDHISTERTYEGRIDGAYKIPKGGGQPSSVSGGTEGDDISFVYTFHIVDSNDSFEQTTPVAPFRRFISSTLADHPQIKCASPGDPCRVDFSGGTVRLLDVLEQYVVGECTPPVTPGFAKA